MNTRKASNVKNHMKNLEDECNFLLIDNTYRKVLYLSLKISAEICIELGFLMEFQDSNLKGTCELTGVC